QVNDEVDQRKKMPPPLPTRFVRMLDAFRYVSMNVTLTVNRVRPWPVRQLAQAISDEIGEEFDVEDVLALMALLLEANMTTYCIGFRRELRIRSLYLWSNRQVNAAALVQDTEERVAQ